MEATLDELMRVYSRLAALRTNHSNAKWVTLETGEEYDSLIERASKAMDRDLSEFRIRGAHLSPAKHHHEGNAFRARIDGVLGYILTLMPREAQNRIGYRPN